MSTKILIIDDDSQNRDILKTRLELAGYEVKEATNGDEGLEAALKEEADLIILDIMMPKKDGWQVCKGIRGNPKTRNVPVIALTARIQPIDEMRSWESGVDEYFQKPVEPATLLASIEKLLSEKGARHGA